MHQDGGQILISETSQHSTILDHQLLHYSSTAKRRVVLVAEGSKDQAEGWAQKISRTRQYHSQCRNYVVHTKLLTAHTTSVSNQVVQQFDSSDMKQSSIGVPVCHFSK